MTKAECYEVIFHFRDYKEAKAMVDANWNIDADGGRIHKLELRVVKE